MRCATLGWMQHQCVIGGGSWKLHASVSRAGHGGAQGWVWGSTGLGMEEHRAGYGRALSGNEWKGPLAGVLTTCCSSWDIAFLAMEGANPGQFRMDLWFPFLDLNQTSCQIWGKLLIFPFAYL